MCRLKEANEAVLELCADAWRDAHMPPGARRLLASESSPTGAAPQHAHTALWAPESPSQRRSSLTRLDRTPSQLAGPPSRKHMSNSVAMTAADSPRVCSSAPRSARVYAAKKLLSCGRGRMAPSRISARR